MIPLVAKRYARSLFELAVESGDIAAIEADLLSFGNLLSCHSFLRDAMKNPCFSGKEQAAALEEIARKTGMTICVQNFLRLVILHRRFFYIDEMITAYRTLSAKFRQEVGVRFISACTLLPQQKKELEGALKKAVGKSIVIEFVVDPDLLDGSIVQIGSYRIDVSLKTRLDLLGRILKKAC